METIELVVPYISVAITIVMGVLLVAMAIAMRNANKFLQKAVDEKDAEIEEGFKKMKTLVQFAKIGYRVPSGETVSHVGDGYIVTSDQNGHGTATINIENLDTGLEYELYELKIKMIEYDMKARAYLAMCSARMAQEDIMKILH